MFTTSCLLVVAVGCALDLMIARQVDLVQDADHNFDPRKGTRIDHVVEVLLIEIVVVAVTVLIGWFHGRTSHVALVTIRFR